MSSRRLQDMSSRRFEDVFSVTIFHLPRRLEDVLKMSLRRLARGLENVFKTSSRRLRRTSSRCLQDVLEDVRLLRWRRVEDVLDVFKTCLEDVFKTSVRATNVCWVLSKVENVFHRGVLYHGNEEWCKIWRGIDLSIRNWHEELDESWPEHSTV